MRRTGKVEMALAADRFDKTLAILLQLVLTDSGDSGELGEERWATR